MADAQDPLASIIAAAPPLKQRDPLDDIIASAPPIRRQVSPIDAAWVREQAAPPQPTMHGWLQEQAATRKPEPIAPPPLQPPPSTVIAQPNGPLPPMPKMNEVGAIQPPVPAPIPGMEKLGPLPGVPVRRPPVGQPPIPRQPMEEYMGPRSDEYVIADDPVVPAFVRGVTSAVGGTVGGVARALGEADFSRSGPSKGNVGAARGFGQSPGMAPLPPAPPPVDSTQNPVQGALRSVGQSVAQATESVEQTFARDKSIKDFMADPQGAISDPRWWLDTTFNAAGSMAPMAAAGVGTSAAVGRIATMAPEIATAALRYGPSVAAGLTESAQVFGSTYEEARKAGIDPETARQVGALVAAGTALTAIPAHKVGIFNDGIRSIGKRIATSSAAEGGQEGVQTWWENVVAKTFYDPQRPLLQGVPEAVVGSAIVGGALGSGGVNERTPAPPTPEMQSELDQLARENRGPDPLQQIIDAAPPIEAKPVVLPAPPIAPAESPLIPPQQAEAVQPLTPPPAANKIVDTMNERSPADDLVRQGQEMRESRVSEGDMARGANQVPEVRGQADVGVSGGNAKSSVLEVWEGNGNQTGANPEAVAPSKSSTIEVSPGPRKEVVQPATVESAAPVAAGEPDWKPITSKWYGEADGMVDYQWNVGKDRSYEVVPFGNENQAKLIRKWDGEEEYLGIVEGLDEAGELAKEDAAEMGLYEQEMASQPELSTPPIDRFHAAYQKLTGDDYGKAITLADVQQEMGITDPAEFTRLLADLDRGPGITSSGAKLALPASTGTKGNNVYRDGDTSYYGIRFDRDASPADPGPVEAAPQDFKWEGPLPKEAVRAKEPLNAPQPPDPGPVDTVQQEGPVEWQDGRKMRRMVNAIDVDPIRFQYKVEGVGQKGVSSKLRDVQGWNERLAGTVQVWKDPTDGKVYVVNGHHRVELAKRVKQPDIAIEYLDAKTAEEARAIGALTNIGEGNGTAIDAAKFMRDTGMTIEDIRRENIPLTGAVARDGVALSNLSQSLFDDVVHGNLTERRGAIIGEALPNHADQMGAIAVIRDAERRGKRLTDAEVKELIRRTANAERKVEQQDTLFGIQEMTQNLALEEAQLSNFIRSRLGNEKKLFSAVGSQSAADRLGAVGNKIDAAANQQVAEQADQAIAVYDKLSLSAGPISDALREGARRIANGEKLDAVKEGVYAAVRGAVANEIAGRPAAKQPDVREAESRASVERPASIQENRAEKIGGVKQETLVTDIEARESQIAAKNDRNRPLAEVPFSLIQEKAPQDPGPPDDRQSSMFEEPESDSEVARFRPGKPRPAPPPRAPGKTGTMVSRSEIVSDLSRFLKDIPIKTGGFREKAAGIFKIRQEVIRSKKPLDLPTIAHEIGHAIHKYLWGVSVNKKNLNSRPLRPFRHELGALDYDPNLMRPFEGFAEYIRLRLTEPATAAKRAPKFHAWFEKQLGMHPDLAKVLDQAQTRIGEWDAQPATAKIAASINTKDTPQAKWMGVMERAWTESIDDRAPIKKAVEEFAAAGAPVETAANAYKLSRLLSGWSEKAMQFLEEGTFDANSLKTTSKPLKEILLPLLKKGRKVNPAFEKLREDWGVDVAGDGLDDLRVYLVARRMQNYQSQGLETGFSKDEVKKAVNATKTAEIETAAGELQGYQDAVLRYVVDRGGLSESAYDTIKEKNSFYVPLYRVMDPTDTKMDVSAGGRKMIDINSPIRKRTGSVREVIDPLESIVKNTYAMISYADRNAVGQALVKQAERAQGKGSLLESGISAGTKVTKFNLKEVEPKIKEILKDADIDADDVDFDALAAIYRPRTDPIGSKNQVAITVDGERQLFEMNPELKKAMDVTEYSTRHMLLKLFQAPANLLRFGATGAGPEFIIRNPLRDSFDAAMQSNHNFKPIIDTIWGGITMISNPEMVNEMVRAGGGGAGIMPIGRKALRRYLDEMLVSKPKYVLRHPLEIFHVMEQAMRWAGDKTERMTRVGEYRLAKKKQKAPEDAAMDARDVSLDFSRMGSVARAINPYVAFFAPSLNGTARFFENHAKNPVRTATRGFAYITIPTIALWMLNKDDEDYKEIEPWKKNLFWLIPTKIFPKEVREKVGPFIPIPRAHLYGLFYGNLVERALDAAYKKKPDAFKGFGKDMISSMMPPISPTGVAPTIEAITNYSFFTGQNIENRSMETLLAQHRSTPRTSDTAKAISNSLGQLGVDISPVKIEHIFYGHTAGLGRAALLGTETAKRAATGETRNRPASSWSEMPFLRAFSTPEIPNNPASVNKMYEEMDKLRKLRDSRKSAEKIPDGPAAGARALTREERSTLGRLEQAARTLSSMNAQSTKIQYDKAMSPEEKKEKLVLIQKAKLNLARRALGLKEMYK